MLSLRLSVYIIIKKSSVLSFVCLVVLKFENDDDVNVVIILL